MKQEKQQKLTKKIILEFKFFSSCEDRLTLQVQKQQKHKS